MPLIRLSIRHRVALWNAVAFTVIIGGLGVAVYGLLRQVHLDQVDRMLVARYEALRRDPRLAQGDDPAAILRASLGDRHDLTGRVVGTPMGEPPGPPPAERMRRPPAAPTVRSLSLPDDRNVRQLTTPLTVAGQAQTVVLEADLQHVDEELSAVFGVLVVATSVSLVVAAALAYGLAWQTLAPVAALREAAEAITADRLHRRLPIGHPTDELGRLGQTFNTMIARLEASFEEVRRFTADASHELRTPLAVIRSEAELGLALAQNLDEARERLASILEEAARLTTVTDQLLTLSREDAGAAERTSIPVALAPLLREVVESFRPRAEAARQELTFVDNPIGETAVPGDPERFRRVFHNLVDNALKYTPPGGHIAVSLDYGDEHAVVTVQDDGIGIPAEHRVRVFDRFYRVPGVASPRAEGAGLGLSIVHDLVTSSGGRVEIVPSSPGTSVRVLLPRSNPET